MAERHIKIVDTERGGVHEGPEMFALGAEPNTKAVGRDGKRKSIQYSYVGDWSRNAKCGETPRTSRRTALYY